MRRVLVLAGFALVATATFAEEATAPHVTVVHEGIGAPYAEAIAETLSVARQVYVDAFGFDMPDRVSAKVTCPADETRLYTDGNDGVFLSLASKDDLAPPAKSGVFNLYGMCHELGHVAMYRTLRDRPWITHAGAEGWAHWTGSVVLDRVFEKKGEKLWPAPYDYRPEGTARLTKALKASKPSPIDRGAGAWQALDAILGHEELPKVFETWQQAGIDPTQAKAQLGKALQDAWPEKAKALDAWWKASADLLVEDRAASAFARKTIEPTSLRPKPIVLSGDDGTAESKRSIAGSGHARAFVAPSEGDAYLTAVSVYGARYGPPTAPKTEFEIALCDEAMHPIATWKAPYADFAYGEMDWARFEIPPTRVPPTFQVCVSFAPTATNGVYVGIDQGTKGHSRATLPDKAGDPLPNGDWMIRAEVKVPKGSGPLGK